MIEPLQFLPLVLIGLTLAATPVAAEEPVFALTIKDHRYMPAEFEVPANVKIKLLVKNEDSSPEEFESAELHREKVVLGNSEITVFIGPLKPGRYEYIGDFHQESAHGVITAK
jgi:hypothetical protein